jgi:hypothetical protein
MKNFLQLAELRIVRLSRILLSYVNLSNITDENNTAATRVISVVKTTGAS